MQVPNNFVTKFIFGVITVIILAVGWCSKCAHAQGFYGDTVKLAASDESTFPNTPDAGNQFKGGIRYGTDAGKLYLNQGGSGWTSRVAKVQVDDINAQAYGIPAFLITFHRDFGAGAGGVADDIVVVDAGVYAFTFRVFNMNAYTFAAVGGSTLVLRSDYDGGGVALSGVIPTNSTGRDTDTRAFDSRTVDLRTNPLVVRRSDNGVGAEVVIQGTLEP